MSQHFAPTKAENAHNDPKFHESSTHHERLHQSLVIGAVRQGENTQHRLDSAKAFIKAYLAYRDANQAHLAETKPFLHAYVARLEPDQARFAEITALFDAFEAHSTETLALGRAYLARAEPGQAHLDDMYARLMADYARLLATNENDSGKS
jgi:hypothetical protein